MKNKNIPAVIALAALAAILYANTFWNKFVYDDYQFIVKNEYIKSLNNIPLFFTSMKSFAADGDFLIYRPLVTLSFAVDRLIWGESPYGYHLLNFLFHASSGILLYLVLNAVFGNILIAFMTAVLFLSSPLQTEAVTWISSRGNSMCAFFFLLSFLFFVRYRNFSEGRGNKYYTYCLIAYSASLLIKETAACLPLIMMAYDLYRNSFSLKGIDFKKPARIYIPTIMLTCIYILIRFLVLGRMSQFSYWGGGIVPTLITMTAVIAEYIVMLFLPFYLNVDRLVKMSFSILSFNFIAPFIFLCLVIFYAVRIKKTSPGITFGIAWFFITLLPVSNIIPIQALIAERFLYLPSIGFFICLSFILYGIIQENKRYRIPVIIMLALVVVLYSARTITRNLSWRDNFSLWNETVNSGKCSYTAYNNLANYYFGQGNLEKAKELYLESLSINPRYEKAMSNLAYLYASQNNLNDSERWLKILIETNPEHKLAYYYMGLIYSVKNEPEAAIENYERAAALNPSFSPVFNNLGYIYSQKGIYDKAIENYRKALEIDPETIEAYNNLGYMYYLKKDFTGARKYFENALKINPGYEKAKQNLMLLNGKK